MSQGNGSVLEGRRKYMTVKEVAEYLGIGRTSAYDLIASGQLEAKRFGKKNVRVSKYEVERYEQESTWESE